LQDSADYTLSISVTLLARRVFASEVFSAWVPRANVWHFPEIMQKTPVVG